MGEDKISGRVYVVGSSKSCNFMENGVCKYSIILAGSEFGRDFENVPIEYVPIALAAAGIEAVVALSFRGEIPNLEGIRYLESTLDLTGIIKTGEKVEINLTGMPTLQRHSPSKKGLWPVRQLRPLLK